MAKVTPRKGRQVFDADEALIGMIAGARAGAARVGPCLLVLVGGLGGCAGATPTPGARVPSAAVATVGPTVPSAVRAAGGTGPPGTYLDPALTPGDVFPGEVDPVTRLSHYLAVLA
jgi:hypothetical protein